MDFVEQIRISDERAETGFCAEENHSPAVLGARIISRIGVAENPSAERDELFRFFAF